MLLHEGEDHPPHAVDLLDLGADPGAAGVGLDLAGEPLLGGLAAVQADGIRRVPLPIVGVVLDNPGVLAALRAADPPVGDGPNQDQQDDQGAADQGRPADVEVHARPGDQGRHDAQAEQRAIPVPQGHLDRWRSLRLRSAELSAVTYECHLGLPPQCVVPFVPLSL